MTTYNKLGIETIRTFYVEAGNKTLPAVLLLHGFPSSHMFRELIPRAGRRLPCAGT